MQGLLVRDRADAEDLEDHKLPYIQVGGAGHRTAHMRVDVDGIC